MDELSPFQPLVPEERVIGPLVERAAALVADCHRLSTHAGHSLGTALGPRLRAMNSYYTNKIEGQHTRPADIERALARQFDADEREARKQRLAVAHMAAEEELEATATGASREAFYSLQGIRGIHGALYRRLPESDRITEDGQAVVPGELRTRDVVAGLHVAPAHDDVPQLVSDWAERYRELPGTEMAVVGAACAHHRLLWIHPFIDGNGRTARLHSHLVLHTFDLTQGLWSPMRGLARTHEQYYARLNNADWPRRNDLDGRGPPSQEGLVAFAAYFLDACIDQARFMREMLDFGNLRERLADLLAHLASRPWQMGSEKSAVRPDALEALHYAAMAGPLTGVCSLPPAPVRPSASLYR